ncbi:MAG: hypothetical protein RIG77_17350 [Cyclobacteriaceae bacterium]
MNYHLINYELNGHGESGESCNSRYDLTTACETCGTGAKLLEPLKVKGLSNCKKHLFRTLDGDWLISSELYKSFTSKIKLNLIQVENTRNQALEFWHLTTSQILPKADLTSSGFVTENQCETCYRNGYFNDALIGDLKQGRKTVIKPLKLIYSRIDLNADIYQTWEHVGLSNKVASGNKVIRYARPCLVISERLRNLLTETELPHILYQKVEINGVQQAI